MDYQYATTAEGLGVGTPAQSAYRNDSKVLVPMHSREGDVNRVFY
jgi:hypothetical protein